MFRIVMALLCVGIFTLPTFAADLTTAKKYLKDGQYDLAFNEFKQLAEKGNAEAQFELALRYIDGQGVEKNEKAAFSWYLKSAKKGYVQAQNNLAACYRDGIGTSQDCKQAIKWFTEAANKGDVESQNSLGYAYVTGECATKDYSKALKWYKKAANAGSSAGQYSLGLMYLKGYGVTKSNQQAIELFEKAAAQGHEDAKKQLARLNTAAAVKEFSDKDACHIIARADACGFNTKAADALIRKTRNETLEEHYARIGAYQGCYSAYNPAAVYELQAKEAKFSCSDVSNDLQKLIAFLRR